MGSPLEMNFEEVYSIYLFLFLYKVVIFWQASNPLDIGISKSIIIKEYIFAGSPLSIAYLII